ncbi:MAG: hypothetical protein ACO3IV_03315 [Ilumatobacteraceae bacterium]
MQQRLATLHGATRILARNGASGHVAHSIVESCALALRLGADGVDLDAATNDNVVFVGGERHVRRRLPGVTRAVPAVPLVDVVGHVDFVRGSTIALRADEETFRELEPMLPGVLSVVPVSCLLVVDDTVANPSIAPSTTFECYVRSALGSMSGGPERFFANARNNGWVGVVLSDDDWTGGLVTLAHRFGLSAFADSVVREHRAVDLVRMGADVISGRWPERIVAARDAATSQGDTSRPTGM